MKKVSVLIVVSVLLAALLCLAGCGSSFSGEGDSSTSATSESSGSDSANDSSEGNTSSEGSASDSGDDDSAEKSTTKKYTDKEAGFTVSLPSYWIEEDTKDTSTDSGSTSSMEFDYFNGKDYSVIYCFAGGSSDVSFSDLKKEDLAEIYSVSVDDVSKKKLSSGSYYLVDQSNNDGQTITYLTIKNGQFIQFVYGARDKDAPQLSDFEAMVNSAKYK